MTAWFEDNRQNRETLSILFFVFVFWSILTQFLNCLAYVLTDGKASGPTRRRSSPSGTPAGPTTGGELPRTRAAAVARTNGTLARLGRRLSEPPGGLAAPEAAHQLRRALVALRRVEALAISDSREAWLMDAFAGLIPLYCRLDRLLRQRPAPPGTHHWWEWALAGVQSYGVDRDLETQLGVFETRASELIAMVK